VAFSYQTAIDALGTLFCHQAAIGSTSGFAVCRQTTSTDTNRFNTHIIGCLAILRCLTAEFVLGVDAVGFSSANIDALVESARQTIITVLVSFTAVLGNGNILALVIDTCIDGTELSIVARVIANAAIRDWDIITVTLEAALIFSAWIIIVTFRVDHTAVITRNKDTLIAWLIAHILSVDIAIVAVLRCVAAVFDGSHFTLIIDAVHDGANVFILTVFKALTAVIDIIQLTLIGVGIASRCNAHVSGRTVLVDKAAVASRCVETFIANAFVVGARVRVVAIGAIRMAASENRNMVALISSEVATSEDTHIVVCTVLVTVTAVWNRIMLALSVLIAIIVGAHLVIRTVERLVAAALDCSIITCLLGYIALGSGALVALLAVGISFATIVITDVKAHIVCAQIQSAVVGVHALWRMNTASGDRCERTLVISAAGLLADIRSLTIDNGGAAVGNIASYAKSVQLVEWVVADSFKRAIFRCANVSIVAHGVVQTAFRNIGVDTLISPATAVFGARVEIVALEIGLAAVGNLGANAFIACQIA
jgi:hypothetical protein